MLLLALTKAKVEVEIDETASKTANKVEQLLVENGNVFKDVAEALGDAVIYEETGGMVDSRNVDGGRASEAMKLEPGKTSARFISMNGDGYYFVKLKKKTDTEVNFVSLKIPFTEFDKRFNALKEEGKIKEFIDLNLEAGSPIDEPE